MKMPEVNIVDYDGHLIDFHMLMQDISAALVLLSERMAVGNEIAERRADLELRMTNIHVQALELSKELRKPCPHCL